MKKEIALAAIAAAASQALAEPMPYRPAKAFMSTRDIFGLDSRDTDGYHPKQSICGAADTCANACGDEYAQCPSTDNQMHCYNVQANESCCTDGTGNSCDAGYYCTADTSGKTWCCPEGMDVDTCASKFQVTGALTSDAPYVSSTSTSSTSSSTLVASSAPPSSASPSSSPSPTASSRASSHVHSVASSATSGSGPFATGAVFFETGNSTGAGVAAGSGARVGTGATATVSSEDSASATSATDSSSSSGVSTSGASSSSPATFLAVFAAAALAAFF